MQLGRFVDVMMSARESVHLKRGRYRVTLTLSKIATALFLLMDNLLWCARVGLLDVDRRKCFLTSCRFWLLSICMNLTRDWFEVQDLLLASPVNERETLVSCLRSHPALTVDVCKNACDLFIPLSALNHWPLAPKTLGCLGLVSSACALLQLMDPALRLQPS